MIRYSHFQIIVNVYSLIIVWDILYISRMSRIYGDAPQTRLTNGTSYKAREEG